MSRFHLLPEVWGNDFLPFELIRRGKTRNYPENPGPMKFTYYGHACFAVEIRGKKLLFDPFITPNPLAQNIDVDRIEADYILITHGHQDHIEDAIRIAKRTGALVISNYEITVWFGKKGITRTHPLNHGGKRKFDFGTVKMVNAVHTSMLPDGENGGDAGGFLIISDEGNFYYAGDTALTLDMQLIPRWAKLDFAVLPIGDNFTMDVDDAIIASDFIQCNRIVGVHYNTFDLIRIDVEEARRKFQEAGKELILPEIGQTLDL